MKTYTTVQGDMWDSLALQFYGAESHMDVLLQANPDKLNVAVFGAGETIMVPQLPPLERRKSDTLPPWRR